jgi:hypothetical protein
MTSNRKSCLTLVLDLFLVFVLSAILIRPVFKATYLDRWNSIESTFIADGRFLAAHWPYPQWQPLWYCGTRFDFVYPPVLRYGTALLTRFFIPVKAYHVFTALMFCLGIAGVYFLVRVMSGFRGSAWLAAISCALVSPSFLFIQPVRADAPYLMPQRLGVLLRYGEGPHISALSLLPIALAFAFLGIQRSRPASLALASLFCALIALTNFYGATALAMLYPILVWAVWISHRDNRILPRAAVIPALAYGLSAFWLTPSYFRITLDNLRYVAEPGSRFSFAIAIAAVIAFAGASFFWASRQKDRGYTVFIIGGLWFLGLYVLGYYGFHFLVTGNPPRLIPELDMVMLLATAEGLRRLWNSSQSARVLAILVVLGAGWEARHFIRHAWDIYPREPEYQQRVEYRMSEWIATNLPQARTLVDGSVRLWWDTWHDLAQVDGGSDQGLINPNPPLARWEFREGIKPEPSLLWLKALGADAVIVSDETSQDAYRGYLHAPHKYGAVLPVLYDDHQGNVVYGVPRRYPSLARIVRTSDLQAAGPVRPLTNMAALRTYEAVVENGPESLASTAWDGTDAMRVHAKVGAGESVLVQETYDAGWHAYSEGRPLRIWKDPMDFMAIDTPPGDREITLMFETPLEIRIGRWVTLAALALCLALFAHGARSFSRSRRLVRSII